MDAKLKEIQAPTAGSENTVSLDQFLDGTLSVLQFKDQGHRAGLDAILLAACLPKDANGTLADLGAGVGVAGLAALNSRPRLHGTLVEIDQSLHDLSKRTVELPENSAIASRVETVRADVTLSGVQRKNAGLEDNSFDFVIMNPPYNEKRQFRASNDPKKTQAYVMGAGGLDCWMRTACAILKPGGMLAMIYRTQDLGQIIAASQGRFGALTIIPVHSHSTDPAKRILLTGIKASNEPLHISPGLVVHENDGSFTHQANALLTGQSRSLMG